MEKNAHMAPLHKIIVKNSYSQALFFWVHGAINADSNLSPRMAIKRFSKEFGLENSLDIHSACTQYNRMKTLHNKQKKVFEL